MLEDEPELLAGDDDDEQGDEITDDLSPHAHRMARVRKQMRDNLDRTSGRLIAKAGE
jgi:hypothetical protein